jgi:hypothetical protein
VQTIGTVKVRRRCLSCPLVGPPKLEAGDSIHFDSKMGHAVVSCSAQDAEVLWVCTGTPTVE